MHSLRETAQEAIVCLPCPGQNLRICLESAWYEWNFTYSQEFHRNSIIFSLSLSLSPYQDLDEHKAWIRYWAALIEVEREYYYKYKTAYKILTAIGKKLETLTAKSQFSLHFIK